VIEYVRNERRNLKLTEQEVSQMAQERADYAALVRHLRHDSRTDAIEGLELTCIGNAGGADSMVHGRAAGGLLLRGAGRAIAIDPGQNSLALLAGLGFNAHDLTDVFASHAHNDHVGDLSIAISAALELGLGEPFPSHIVVCPSLVDYNSGASTRFGFTVPAYAWRGQVHALYWEPLTVTRFDGLPIRAEASVAIGDTITVHSAEGRHGQVKVTGFVIDTPFGRVGYTSDTEWFPELPASYRQTSVLWMNMNTLALDAIGDVSQSVSRDAEPVHNHLGYLGVCRLIEQVQPKTAVISHLGAQLLDRREEVQHLLRARFADRGITIVCPANGHSLVFERSLEDPPLCRRFVP